MDASKLAKASLDDIVFEGRNRAYGAFLLRRLYNKHVTIAAIIAITLFLLFLSIPLIARLLKEEEPEPVVERIVTEVELAQPPPIEDTPPPPPPPPPPDLPPPPPPVRASVKFTPPVVKKDAEVVEEEEVPDVETLEKVDAGVKTVEGNPNAPIDLGEIDGTGTSEIVAEVVEEKPYTYVEQMPTFPGGEQEMLKFLAKNIRYPAAAQRAGVEGLVVLSFVVSRTGEISEIQVIKKLGAGTDEEAARVVGKMPKWTPGKQNGRAVPVRYTLPVRFTIK